MMRPSITPEELFAKLDDAWNAARGERAMPRRSDIDPIKLGTVLQYVSLLDVVPGKRIDFRYRLIGQQLIRAYGRNITGESHLANFDKNPPHPFYDGFVRCTETREAQEMSSDFRNFNNTPCRARGRVLPLSEDGETVTGLLGACLYLEVG